MSTQARHPINTASERPKLGVRGRTVLEVDVGVVAAVRPEAEGLTPEQQNASVERAHMGVDASAAAIRLERLSTRTVLASGYESTQTRASGWSRSWFKLFASARATFVRVLRK